MVTAVEPVLVEVRAVGGGELAGGEDVVVAVAVSAGAMLPAEAVAVGAVEVAVGVGEAVAAQSLDDAAFGRLPAGFELVAEWGGAGVLPVADGAVVVFGVGVRPRA